ncbi:MAG TPA: hypothetical protein VHB21_15550, partial [Minicystis sp.]|nr:hypothetical protein [Minicystis sp.]
PAPAARATTAPSPPSPSGSAANGAPAQPKPGSVVAATDADKRVHRAYLEALGRARKLTRERKYDAAVAAFAEAEKLEPGDADALGERGYAELLQGSIRAARADLARAAQRTTDPKTLGRILYNEGLAEEKAGLRHRAHELFARADALAPSAAAKAHAAATDGAKDASCGVEPELAVTSARAFHGFLEAYRALARFDAPPVRSPATDDEARDALLAPCSVDDGAINRFPDAPAKPVCHAGLDDGSAFLIAWPDGGSTRYGLALEDGGAVFVVTRDELARLGGRCGPPGVELDVRRSGPLVRVRMIAASPMATMMCLSGEDAGSELAPCDDTHLEPAGSACGGPSVFDGLDLFVDPKAHATVLAYALGSNVDEKRPRADLLSFRAEAKDGAVVVAKDGCEQRLRIGASGP